MTSGRYLLYKDYQSGLCNEVLSVELAVGIAHLTGRSLVYYGSAGDDRTLVPVPNQLWTSPPSRTHLIDNARTPTILDLLDEFPVPSLTYAQFRGRTAAGALRTHHAKVRLVGSVFVDPKATVDKAALAEFAGERAVISDREEEILLLDDTNLGYYSRVFFDPPPSFHDAMAGVVARKPYRDLAAEICRALGPFNGVHVRLNDFRKFLPYRGLDYPLEILKNLAANLPADELLVISTDESENAEFFAPILEHFPRHVFVDHLIVRDFAEAFRALPFTDEVTLAWMSNLVLRGANEFLGTPGSSFSGLIQRYVALAQAEHDLFASPRAFKFTYPGSATMDVPFEDGAYLETRPGRYSWTRLGWSMEEETKSWYREWPEAIPAKRSAKAAPTKEQAEARPRFTMSTSFRGPGVPAGIGGGRADDLARRRAVEREIQTIACDLMFGAERASAIARLMALGAPEAEARRIIETADTDPLIMYGRTMALVLRKRDWLLEALEKQQRIWPHAAVIERKSALAADEFLERYYSRGRPVILTDMMRSWPALERWAPGKLAAVAAGVEAEIIVDGGARAGGPNGDRRRRMAFEEFVEAASRPDGAAYLLANRATHNSAVAARLWPDLGALGDYLDGGAAEGGPTIWIGASGLLTPFHHDLVNGLIAQIAGRNRFKIVAAGEVAKLYNQQQVLSEIRDLDGIGPGRFPALANATIHDVTLAPGEILFVPLAWWYQVKSEGFAASVTYTNFRWPNDFYRSYPQR